MSESITFDFDNIQIHVYFKSLVLLNLQILFVYLIRVLVLNLGLNNYYSDDFYVLRLL